MRSPKDMGIIQIDITNACVHQCSNCTRFCGHHAETFFMDFDTFKNAVDSLDEFPRVVGMIGGEPTIHPEFEKFADYIRERRVKQRLSVVRQPIPDMMDQIIRGFGQAGVPNTAGLWCSLNLGYYKHFETINDTFPVQLLNDHNNTCLHQALLMPRKELGISDEEWIEKRDACWVQNTWSATITPKGAFFCEVAGSLDMLFHGPGGWKVEPGWWKRSVEDFKDQLHWCELCSACIDVPQRISNDERDDITPQMYERLKSIGSPKIKKGMYVVHDPDAFDKSKYHTFTTNNAYMDAADNKRTSRENRNVYPKDFVCMTWDEYPAALAASNATDWVIVSKTSEQAERAKEYFKNVIINPGCLYFCTDTMAFNVTARSLREILKSSPESISGHIWSYYPLDKLVFVDLAAVYKEQAREEERADFLSRVVNGKKIVVYGAGKYGKRVFSKLLMGGECDLRGWVDQNYEQLGYPVQSAESLDSKAFDCILVAIRSKEIYEEVRSFLEARGIEGTRIAWAEDV